MKTHEIYSALALRGFPGGLSSVEMTRLVDAVRACVDKALAAAKEVQPQAPCQYCDGTGDVHTPTGEWRGQCSCEAGKPQQQMDSYCERWYGSGKERGWWIVRGGLVKREHIAFLGESAAPEDVSKIVAALNAAHPQATKPQEPKVNIDFWRPIWREPQASEPAWLPIETAPRDGAEIVMTNGVDVSSGKWFAEDDGSRDLDGAPNGDERDAGWMDWSGGMQPDPTHWMPLPAAPEATK